MDTTKNTTNTLKKLTLFSVTWPIFIEMLLHMLMGNADTLMLSQYSDHSVAAVGVSNQILFIIIVMLGFVAIGTSVLVAQHIGAKQEIEAREVAITSITINLLFGIVLSGIMLLFGSSLLTLLNIPAELLDEASQYIKIVGGIAFVQAIIMTISAILRSYGYTKDAMYVTIGMNAINIIGNYLFIFGPFGIPVLGVQGVALSTSGSRLIGLIAIVIILVYRLDFKIPFVHYVKLKKQHIVNIFKIGIPSAGEHLSYNTSQMCILFFITMMGTEDITTRIYAQNVTMLIILFGMSIAQGTQILIGQRIGAKETEEAYRMGFKSLRLSIYLSITSAVIVYIFAEQLLGIFTENATIIAVGTTLLLLNIILEPGRCLNMVLISSLRAAGDVRFPVYMGILSMWGISVTLSYVLGIYFGLGLVGIWIAFIADEWFRGLFMLWRWRSKVWENMSFVHVTQTKKEEAHLG
ncbi:MATE family efflux transporter [Caldalkalibacillus mannanilyticus]|uniref:MATE family efflux transporter n=1 Tax=Caldalkalibacillus mannanilyticus TaxID=1418 RepID=UPI00046AFC32|nr:MATE family efflux transporter [Caldalkalibacillus mannanilyticus]